MTQAICFSCGLTKVGPFSKCSNCSIAPKNHEHLVLSLALSGHLSTTSQLIHYGHEIRSHLRSSIPQSLLDQAEQALQDPQLISKLDKDNTSLNTPRADDVSKTMPSIEASKQDTSSTSGVRFSTSRSMEETVFDHTPFVLLGATIRDDRKRIMDLAEEKSLEIDAEICQKARSDLINPRTRLAIEMAWLPGVSPRKAIQLLEALKRSPLSISTETGLPDLAFANLVAASFMAISEADKSKEVSSLIQYFAGIVEYISADEILRDLNEDRAVSGFPDVKSLEVIEEELENRKRYYRKAVTEGLNNLSPEKLVEAITDAVNEATLDGIVHAPALIDEIVDNYELEVATFLSKESQNIDLLATSVLNQAKSGDAVLRLQIDKLEKVLKNWDRIVKPIQISAKARGLDHEPSKKIGYKVRSLAIDLFNEHGQIIHSQRITQILRELFSEISELSERAEKDATDLHEIAENRKAEEKKQVQLNKDISFKAEVGLMFKDDLEIGPDGVVWKGKKYPLSSITAVKWGAVRNSVNGIPTGTDYYIGLADRNGSANIHLRKEATYNGFINALWKAVCVRLLIDMLEALKKGQKITIGNMVVEDTHVTLTRHKFLSSEKVRVSWSDVTYQSWNGQFIVGYKNDKKVDGTASFQNDWNTHILDSVVSGAFKKWTGKLSDYLN